MEQYPYFINPDIDALPSASAEERTRLVRRIAACVGDEATLRTLIGIDPAEFASFYPDMQSPQLSTEATIDSFINRFASEQAAEAPEIEELVVAPAVDYATMLESEADDSEDSDFTDSGSDPDSDSTDSTASLIDSFLKAVPPKSPKSQAKSKSPARPQAQAAPTLSSEAEGQANPDSLVSGAEGSQPESVVSGAEDSQPESVVSGAEGSQPEPKSAAPEAAKPDSSLSEALFRLMVKNGNYTKALEIINELSLNNPKKSIYFAYQMRFLKKLIKNQENAKP